MISDDDLRDHFERQYAQGGRPDRDVRSLGHRLAPRALSEDPDMTLIDGNRKQRRTSRARSRPTSTISDQHRQQRQGDEIACSCGRRWPVGENHP